MIIDSHHHLWRYSEAEYPWVDDTMTILQRDYDIPRLTAAITEAEIAATVAVQARSTRQETDWLIGLANKRNRIAGVVGWIDLEAPDLEQQLQAYDGERKLKGFRHVLQDETQRDFVCRPAFKKGLRIVAEAGYRYDVLVHRDQLTHIESVAQELPEVRMVLDHVGKPNMQSDQRDREWARQIASLAKNTRICCKLSGLVTEAERNAPDHRFFPYIEHIMDCFGNERTMFGSDWPVCLVSRPYVDTKNLLHRAEAAIGFSFDERFWSGNAREFYSLAGADDDGTTRAA